MKSTQCCIVIPLYKDYLFDFEELSLKQCIKLLNNNYKIYFIGPDNLNIIDVLNKYDINIKYIEDYNYIVYNYNYFSSIEKFNELLIYGDLYHILKEEHYSYMLLYELDGFVNYDNLQYWIDKQYDYIGSFGFTHRQELNLNVENQEDIIKHNKYMMIGGVSLRNIDFCINTFKYTYGKDVIGLLWEDIILSFYSKVDNKKPYAYETFNFCWSYNYEMSYILNNYKLPMFLHYYYRNAKLYETCKHRYENNITTIEI